MYSDSHRIAELAAMIAENTTIVDKYLTLHNLPTPSLNVDAPAKLPIDEEAVEIEAARIAIIEATSELRALMMGPLALLRVNYTEFISLNAITRFNIDRTFPVGEEASYGTISKACNVDEQTLRRIIRHGMTSNLFHEPRKGVVAHTGLTKLLAEDDLLHDWVSTALDELWPAAVKTVDAISKWPGSQEITQSASQFQVLPFSKLPNDHQQAFSLANNTDKSMWELFTEDPERGQKFGRSMSLMSNVKGYDPRFLLDSYPWEDVADGTVVDVGGSHGSVSISIAERFPLIKCVVQDLPVRVEEGRSKVPGELANRVTFMAHDFFTQQPITANVYYFRWIFHNWSDKYCIEILQNLIPALKPGARILINDLVVPEPNSVSPTEERIVRNLDLVMFMLLNSQERDADEWADLFRRADPRFKYLGIRQPPGALLSMIEASWEG